MMNTTDSFFSLAFAAQLFLLTLAVACGDDDGMTGGADGSLPGEGLENCANGVDDDGDGDTDCADLDCLVGVLDTSAPTRTWELMSWVVEPLPEGTCPPPQTIDGVLVPGEAMPRDRVASVNGRVIDSDGEPIRRARVRVLGREEAGAVETRADGRFDLLLDPRSRPVLVFEAANRLGVQRALEVADGSQTVLDDVVLIPRSDEVTTIRTGAEAGTVQVARGSVVRDADGERRATLLFPTGVRAVAHMGDGTDLPLTTLSVRATEYTTGERGLEAMPGALPSASAYTYAAELSVDEVAGMEADVHFDKPVSFYVDNFLSMPVGTPVPLGFYDRREGRWEAEPDGIVLAIVGVRGGVASIDTDGDGVADDVARLASFGITHEEREALGATYSTGTELWRSSLDHFSPWDCNWPFGFPPDAIFPALLDALENLAKAACTVFGSVVDCEHQTLGESVAIAGTGNRLHYQSDRMLGFEELRTIDIPLLAEDPPDSLERIDVELQVAGHRFTESFEPERDARFTHTWDGLDRFGRTVQGAHRYRLSVTYVYEGVYRGPSEPYGLTFARPGEILLTGNRTREEVGATRVMDGVFHVIDATQLGLGGFTLDVNHTYDPTSGTIHFGDGRRRSGRDVGWAADPAAGGGSETAADIPAMDAALDATGLAVGPDGSLYIADGRRHRIVRRDPMGTIRLVAGRGTQGYSGDGGPAIAAELNFPTSLDFGPDGSLYFASGRVGDSNYVIRRVDPGGNITTVAGNGARATEPRQGDGGLATDASLTLPRDLAVGPDGSIWVVSDSVSGIGSHFRVIDPGGRITTWTIGDAGVLQEVAFGPRDQPYFTVGSGIDARLYRMLDDGRARLLAGGGAGDPTPVNVPGPDARYSIEGGLAVARDGRVFIGGRVAGSALVLELGRDGLLRSIGGGGPRSRERCPAGAARGAGFGSITALAYSEGELFVGGHPLDGPVCRMHLPFATVGEDGRLRVPAPSGAAVFVFDERGRHLETTSAYTEEPLWRFEYQDGGEGPLVAAIDGSENALTIRRWGARPAVIEGPYGHITRLELDGRGRISAVVDPMERTSRFVFGPNDLLVRMTDPAGGEHIYGYGALGRLEADTNAGGATQTFARTTEGLSRTVRHETPEGLATLYGIASGGDDELIRELTRPSGLVVTGVTTPGRSEVRQPDGSVAINVLGADPRFGMVAAIPRQVVLELPSGLQSETTAQRTVTLDPAAPAGLARMVDAVSHSGRDSTTTWDGVASTLTSRTPTGRESVMVLDHLGRLVSGRVGSLPETAFVRDGQGRVVETRQEAGEARVATNGYGADGLLESTANGLGDRSTFERDRSGWLVGTVDGEGRRIGLVPDALGAIDRVERPGGHVHTMSYDADGRVIRWQRPEGGVTSYRYDADGSMLVMTPPSGRQLTRGYDGAGRQETATVDGETEVQVFDLSTGQLVRATSTSGEVLVPHYDGRLSVGYEHVGVATVAVAHDTDLRMTRETLTAGSTAPSAVDFRYDDDGRLVGAGALNIALDSMTALPDSTDVGVLETSFARNPFGEVELAILSAGAARLYEVALARDLAARLVSETTSTPAGSVTYEYEYDQSGKLTDWRVDGAPVGQYTYDGAGLRTVTVDDRGRSEASYDLDDRVTAFGAVRFEHDADGYRSARVDGSARTTYAHDGLGQLRSVTLEDGRRVAYRYDVAGRRVARTVGGSSERAWTYGSALGPSGELDARGDLRTRFIYGTAPHVPDLMVRDGVTYRLVHDARGSVRQVVRVDDGSILQEVDYDPWGRVLADTNPGFQPFAFAGGVRDPDTGLLRMGLRDYDPETGRFLTPDPIGMLGGLDLYGYVEDDPVNLVDPTGTHPLLWAFGVAVGCQLLNNGGDVSAIDWGAVAFAVAFDMIGGPLIKGVIGIAGKAGARAARNLLGGVGVGGAAHAAGALGVAARGAGGRAGRRFGPYTHQINKGGLDDIVRDGQLRSTMASAIAGGADAVRARNFDFLPVNPGGRPQFEFFTDVAPTSVHPTNGTVTWSLPEGDMLDITVTRIAHRDGSVTILGAAFD